MITLFLIACSGVEEPTASEEKDETVNSKVENGTEFGASRVEPLTEGRIHFYFKVPTPVSQTDKPLVLTVSYGEESFEFCCAQVSDLH